MIKFPLTELLDEQACYEWLMKILHPQGLNCPSGHALPAGRAPHDRKRSPIVKYKCREYGRVFHIFTGTDLSGSHYIFSQIMLILRGFLQGQTTQHIAEELGLDYGTLLSWRHRIQRRGFAHLILPMNLMLTIAYLLLVVSVRPFVTLKVSMLVMMMAMAFTRYIAILWKGFGSAYVISCVVFFSPLPPISLHERNYSHWQMNITSKMLN
ncbi:MAG: hypothetical protein AUK48_09465, partial [Oscillatoriales cyanobacterium CG2_30_44_21]